MDTDEHEINDLQLNPWSNELLTLTRIGHHEREACEVGTGVVERRSYGEPAGRPGKVVVVSHPCLHSTARMRTSLHVCMSLLSS